MMRPSEREKAMKKLSAARLAEHDAHLFLNTHPYDKNALEYFHKQRNMAKKLSDEFVAMYGPINVDQVESLDEWTWINNPWPWEMED